MGRNKLIYAQAALTVIAASDDGTGGTWSGATEALKHGYGTVAVWRGDGEGPGNQILQQRGALPVSSLQDVEALLDGRDSSVPEPNAASANPPEQQSLFATTTPAQSRVAGAGAVAGLLADEGFEVGVEGVVVGGFDLE